jgi:peptide/nickel transport system permease protein
MAILETFKEGGFIHALLTHPKGRIGVAIVVGVGLVALLAPHIAPYDPYDIRARGRRKQPPSAEHYLGTDASGRDVFSMLVHGARISLVVGLATALLISLLAAVMGGMAGYFGGIFDVVVMRAADVLFCIPGLPLMIVLTTYLGPGTSTMVIIFTVLGWAGLARIVRAQVLSVAHYTYVESAKVCGARPWRILWKHILPAVSPIIIINGINMATGMMLAEAGLSFLGFGDPKVVSWGKMLSQAQSGGALLFGMWWWIIPPGLAIFVTALGFLLVGLALEEILNPYLRQMG